MAPAEIYLAKQRDKHSSMRPLGVMQTRFCNFGAPEECDLKRTPCAKCDPQLLTFPQKGELYVAANARRYMMTMPFSFVSNKNNILCTEGIT